MKSENVVRIDIKKSVQQQMGDISRMEYTINNSSDAGDDSIKEDIADPNSVKGSMDVVKNKQKRNKNSSQSL